MQAKVKLAQLAAVVSRANRHNSVASRRANGRRHSAGHRRLVDAIDYDLAGALCVGVELCEPCTTLEGATRPGVIKAYVHRAGLNADILTDGEIAIGDAVERM